MNVTMIKNKIMILEAELKLLKSTIFDRPIEFESDDKLWKSIKPIMKKARRYVYKKTYA